LEFENIERETENSKLNSKKWYKDSNIDTKKEK
jgi:hypothetical protein